MASLKSADMAPGSRPFSFPGIITTGNSSGAQHSPQRLITSRFVEGSMNDRSSRAPPVSFLRGAIPADPADYYASRNNQEEQHGFGYSFTRRSLQMARPSFSSFRGGSSASTSAAASGTTSTSNTSSSISTSNTSSTTTSSGTLRRPRSFLVPFWEGVTKRLRRVRSTLETDMAQAEEHCDTKMGDATRQPPQPTVPAQFADRPSPDEVFANYQKLMQAGFFTKRAIPATRPGLSGDRSIATAATAPVNTTTPSCPDRCPPPPPPPPPPSPRRPAFLSSGTPLSPVPPTPVASPAPMLMATTPRGTKRIRTDVDNNNQENKDSAIKTESIIAASDAPLSSPARTPRKISKRLRKSSRLPGGESLRSIAASESARNSRPSTAQSAAGSVSSRMTRSSQIAQDMEVHQTQPPLPAPVPFVPSTDCDTDVVIPRAADRQTVTEAHMDCRPMDVNIIEVGRPEDTQEPRKRRRSQGPATMQQVQQEASFTSDFGSGSNEVISEEEAQEGTLHPPPRTHYHRPLGPRNPIAANRGSSSSRRAPHKPVLSSATSVVPTESTASPSLDEQAPISFHYPQRVRVRRPVQAQTVEVMASPEPKGRTRSSDPVVDNGHSLPLQDQRDGSHQSKPVTRASRAKNLLFVREDAENKIPVWEG